MNRKTANLPGWDKKGFTLKANSGLWIVSKYPIVKIAETEFVKKKGFDAQSKKGAILFELQSPRKLYLIYTKRHSKRDNSF